ncbi:sugar transporter [Leisingera sp. SS27]|uniref:sugar transporter n=1 Tax=Leisingera sp. SS27 TaxID=2979462 RepID=UPI00232DE0CA|nr:sugar transporter [Leisingera sp. SS27]MDC0660428.1 sugar transporter [Leisingera sp. SS27]
MTQKRQAAQAGGSGPQGGAGKDSQDRPGRRLHLTDGGKGQAQPGPGAKQGVKQGAKPGGGKGKGGPGPKPEPGPGPGGKPPLQQMRERAERAEAEARQVREELAAARTAAYPVAGPARMQTRHWGLLASFALAVLLPLAAAVIYLFAIAEDQYASTAGFTVRSQENSGAQDLLGGLAAFTGTSNASDSDILYEFIQSQEMVNAVEARVGLRAHFTQAWPGDWAFALWPEASAEDLAWYWQRIARIAFDSSSGLIEVQATAYDPETAQAITRAILEESQTRINALNEQARADAMRYAEADLAEALERLKEAREALTRFRTRTRIVDPEADIQGRMGVMNNLQQQLAEALIEYDLLAGSVPAGDVRLNKAQQKIGVIRERIDIERQAFASDSTETGAVGEDYPTLISEFERLTVDREFAEEVYRAALTALELARDDAARQSLYLAAYITPTLAEDSEYPRRFMLSGLAGLFLLLSWSIGALVYYSVRDRS